MSTRFKSYIVSITMLWFGSCDHRISACLLRSKTRTQHSSPNHGLFCCNSYFVQLPNWKQTTAAKVKTAMNGDHIVSLGLRLPAECRCNLTRLKAEQAMNKCRQRQKKSLFPKSPEHLWGPPSLMLATTGVLSSGKRDRILKLIAHPHLPTAEVRNVCSYTWTAHSPSLRTQAQLHYLPVYMVSDPRM